MNRKAVELTEEEAQLVEGEFINVKHSQVRSIEGGHIELQQVGALTIDGEKIDVSQGAAAVIKGGELSLNQSVSVVSFSDNISMNSSFSTVSIAKDTIDVEKSAVGIMISKDITARNTSSLITIAKNVEGNVNTLLDWRSALALGAALGGVLGLVRLLTKK
jgi:hypothetical protein